MANVEEITDEASTHAPLHRSTSGKPKGILKNAPSATPGAGQHLQWDEQNIALTEIQKDSLMKITEPKTPYVRYNAETDEIEGDIPNLDLGRAGSSYSASPTEAKFSSRGATPDPSEHGSRRTSFSSTGRPPISNRSGSGASSRSTSFSLPTETIGREFRAAPGERGEVGEEEEMDEEAAAKHRAFLQARGRHYSKEGEAMKIAKAMIAHEVDDEDEGKEVLMDDDEQSEDSPQSPHKPHTNGVAA